MPAQPQAEQLLEEAVQWAVRLESGRATNHELTQLEQWRSTSDAHEKAWQQIAAFNAEWQQLTGSRKLMHDALDQAEQQRKKQKHSRRKSIKLLGLGILAAFAGSLGWRVQQQGYQLALATTHGERQQLTLPDGTALELNTNTQVQLSYGPLRRIIELQKGEIFINTGADTAMPLHKRSFWVHTPHARLQALGTSFGVRLLDDGSRLQLTAGQVAIHTEGHEPYLVEPGSVIFINANANAPLKRLADHGLQLDSWRQGALVARNMPLTQFLEELSRYQPTNAGKLTADTKAAQLRVTGVFQLDGPSPVDRAIEALTKTLPVRLQQDANGNSHLLAR